MKKVCVIGAGSWGIALAIHLKEKGYEVVINTKDRYSEDVLKQTRQNDSKLSGAKIDEKIAISHDEKCMNDSFAIIIAIPSQSIRKKIQSASKYINKEAIIICCSKGIENNSFKRLSQVIEEETNSEKVVVLSGPSHAEEVFTKLPTTIVAASKNLECAHVVQDMFMSKSLRIYTNDDIIGVEIGGAVKNVIAICAGISDGLGFGDNSKAALITRGIAEITRLGKALEGKSETFSGLAGIGDLIVTCTSKHSRNWKAGHLIGQGMNINEAISSIGMVVEGYVATKVVKKLADKLNVEMPIITQAYKILYNNKNPKEAVYDLMMRNKKQEI